MTSELPPKSLAHLLRRRLRERWPALLAAAGVLSLFFVPIYGHQSSRVMTYGKDLMHVPLFIAVAAVLLYLWPRRRRALSKAGMVAGLAFLTALLVELIQPLTGRSATLGDLLKGAAGAFAAVCVYMGYKMGSIQARRWLVVAALLLLLAGALPFLLVLIDHLTAAKVFPLIDSFERSAEVTRWRSYTCDLEQGPDHATHGRQALKMTVRSDGQRAGAILMDGEMDWGGHRRVAFDVYLEADESRLLAVGLADRQGAPGTERTGVEIDIKPGPNRVVLDLAAMTRTRSGRLIDFSRAQELAFFVTGARPGEAFYLDNLRLSGRAPKDAL